ncbi:hypothetical protein SLE2022_289530 [Rubroshorea leprosula]
MSLSLSQVTNRSSISSLGLRFEPLVLSPVSFQSVYHQLMEEELDPNYSPDYSLCNESSEIEEIEAENPSSKQDVSVPADSEAELMVSPLEYPMNALEVDD